MSSLRELLGLRDRELVSLVGGGGKSTLLFGLGTELAGRGGRVILTTTTKMGHEQAMVAPTVCWSADTACAIEAMNDRGPVMLVTAGDGHKVTGPPPELVDRLYADSDADFVIVEADGSHGRPLKAPAPYEPVIPSATTTLVILLGIDAVGRPLADVAHRVEVACRFTGREPDHCVTVNDCATILAHPDGLLHRRPRTARPVVALTRVTSEADSAAADELSRLLTDRDPQVVTVVVPDA